MAVLRKARPKRGESLEERQQRLEALRQRIKGVSGHSIEEVEKELGGKVDQNAYARVGYLSPRFRKRREHYPDPEPDEGKK